VIHLKRQIFSYFLRLVLIPILGFFCGFLLIKIRRELQNEVYFETIYLEPVEECGFLIDHDTDFLVSETYISPEGKRFYVTMDFENRKNFIEPNHYSPYDIGKMAYLATQIYKEKGYLNSELVQNKLSNIHIFVTNTREQFSKLYNPELFYMDSESAKKNGDEIGAYVFSEREECYTGITEGAEIFFVIKNTHLKYGFNSPLHELIHPISYYGFGNSGAEHDDPRMWIGLNDTGEKDNSVMMEAIRAFNAISENDILINPPSFQVFIVAKRIEKMLSLKQN